MRLPALSFRAKLLLAMVLLVGGVSASTLYFSQLILQRSYLEALQEQFRSQIAFFVERQDTRLAEIKERCASLADSEALRAALVDHNATAAYGAARASLITSFTDALGGSSRPGAPGGTNGLNSATNRARASFPGTGPPPDFRPTPDSSDSRPPGSIPGPGEGRGPGSMPALGPEADPGGLRNPGGMRDPGGMRGLMRGRGTGGWGQSVRILDAEGRVLPTDNGSPMPRGGGGGGGPAGRFEDQLAELGRTIGTWDFQQVAYLAPESDTAGRTFLEVVATRVADPGTKRTLGAVVLGAPMFDRADDLRDLSDILTGFWLEGQLHTHTIPEALRPVLTTRLQEVLKAGTGGTEDFKLIHGSETYRVFLRLLNPGSPFPLTYQVKLYSLDGVLRMERRLQSVILLISLLVLALGAGVSLLLANRLTLSVRELDFATAEVLRGNFQVLVPVRSRDDVGRLVDSFNQMTHGLAQKERYRRVLNLVAGTPVATQLVNADQLPAGESRRITVLFCDVRDFTALTQGMPPDQVIALLNEHMTALTRIVDEHHGFVDKFVGDLIMAVFGAPVAMDNDAARAIACAHQMSATRERMNRGAAHPLGIGIGIATGEAIAGLMGSTDRANYTVLGSCVNLGSRLCAEARAGQILIDAATREVIGESVATVALPPLRLKGFQEPVPAWRVAGPEATVA